MQTENSIKNDNKQNQTGSLGDFTPTTPPEEGGSLIPVLKPLQVDLTYNKMVIKKDITNNILLL